MNYRLSISDNSGSRTDMRQVLRRLGNDLGPRYGCVNAFTEGFIDAVFVTGDMNQLVKIQDHINAHWPGFTAKLLP